MSAVFSGHDISVFQAAYYNLRVWQNRVKKYRILFGRADFFYNQPKEICSHLSEKPLKARFFKADKLQNLTNEGKGKDKK